MRPGGTDPNGGAPLEATDELLKTLWPVVRGVAAGYARDRDEREDLAQECLIRIAGKLPKYRGAVESVEAWARVVAENRCRSLRRADPAGGRVGLDECPEIRDERPSADDLAERAEAKEALYDFIRAGNSSYQVFTLDNRCPCFVLIVDAALQHDDLRCDSSQSKRTP
jgi:RNA polymerase sigma factor (sigma-70 family)